MVSEQAELEESQIGGHVWMESVTCVEHVCIYIYIYIYKCIFIIICITQNYSSRYILCIDINLLVMTINYNGKQ